MGVRGIKLMIGAVVGILMAQFLGLMNPVTAGTIVLLSVGKTRKSSLQSAFIRVKALAIALVLASGIFLLFGFTVYAFAIFLCLYIPCILKFKLDEGLIIGTVSSGQILARGMVNAPVLFNAVSLFIIGVAIAFLLNLYMPDMSKDIEHDQRYIENSFRDILLMMATILRGDKNFNGTIFAEIEAFINQALIRTQTNEENYLRADLSYYGRYIRMRKRQFYVLKQMFELACRFDMELEQGEMIASLTEKLAHTLSEFGTGEETLNELAAFSAACQSGSLPRSRAEFENRAILFQYISEMRHLTALKREFTDEYGEKN